MKNQAIKRVKAWGVIRKHKNDLADTFFSSKKDAVAYYDVVWEEAKLKFPNLPKLALQRIKKNNTVISVEVSYKLPSPKRR